MKKDPGIFLDHIIECADLIENILKEEQKKNFLKITSSKIQ